jgi:hypothetical protein
MEIALQHLEDHLKNHCVKRSIVCEHCDANHCPQFEINHLMLECRHSKNKENCVPCNDVHNNTKIENQDMTLLRQKIDAVESKYEDLATRVCILEVKESDALQNKDDGNLKAEIRKMQEELVLIRSLNLSIQDAYKCNDGVYCWIVKVSHVKKCCRLDSPMCKTSDYVYKFRLCQTDSGDVNIYLILMKGPNDHVLQWPLKCRFSVRIKGKGEIFLSCESDCKSESFIKPESNNIGYGFKSLFNVKNIDDYVHNEHLYIETFVEVLHENCKCLKCLTKKK